jgi:hypothetical protein
MFFFIVIGCHRNLGEMAAGTSGFPFFENIPHVFYLYVCSSTGFNCFGTITRFPDIICLRKGKTSMATGCRKAIHLLVLQGFLYCRLLGLHRQRRIR